MGSAADFQGIPGVFPGRVRIIEFFPVWIRFFFRNRPFLRKRAGGAAAGKLSVEGAGGLCASDMLFLCPFMGESTIVKGARRKKNRKGTMIRRTWPN